MLPGQMMNLPLTITSIMEFAEKVHGKTEIVSITSDNPNHRYTFADAFQRTRQLANALTAAGMVDGDRVATLAWNDYRHFELYYAISCSGGVCHTINPRLFPEQIDYIANHAEDKLIFVDPAFVAVLESVQDKLLTVERYVVLTDAAHMPDTTLLHAIDYESFISDHSDQIFWPDLDENAASALCYTSGTTGNPKGVMYSHRSTVLHSYGAALPDTMAMSVHDVILPIVPMFHVNAWNIIYGAAMIGCKLVLPGAKMGDGETLQRLIEHEQVTMSAGVPTVWLALLAYLRDSGKAIDSLQRVVVGGAACPLAIMEEFAEKHEVVTHHAWGMTETGPLGTFNRLLPAMSKLPVSEQNAMRLKQGRPVFGVDVRIVGETGEVLPWDGESAGEIRIKGNWVCSGYYGIEGGDSHDADGYFGTGDVATIDANAYVKITDRTKDVIKSGGEWISSIELENAAVGHPAVAEAAVIGIPHPKWTERPLLIVVREPGVELLKEEILSYLEGKVAKWWIPEDVEFVDTIPHTATGKISKKDLRVQFATLFPR
ncbi:MAG: acyl-CoA synthetase (AMP-forming)/AMP-acid ligase II [Halieaceae bacterium]|jgi:acyl-CoA synthetase (AMP-forming)/AMP-acid ligase II